MSRQHRITKIPKDYRRLVVAAQAEGWTLTQGRQAHPKLTSPDGTYSTPVPSSSSSPRPYKAITLRLRKHGVPV